MASKLTYAAYCELIDEDLKWLEEQPRTLERDHVMLIVQGARSRDYYDRIPELRPSA